MGILGDLEDFGNALVDGITGDSPNPQFAAVPTVNGGPPGPVDAARWNAPDASGSGQITVHRDVLRKVATGIHSDVAELDAAIKQVQDAGSRLGSFSGWPTGSALGGNIMNACTGFGQVGAHTSDTQSNAAKTLTDSASSYDDAESTSTQAIKSSPGSMIDASRSSVNKASGIL
jgi:hypothetical protein